LTNIDLADDTGDALSENPMQAGDHQQQLDLSKYIPVEVFQQVIASLKAKHKAEKDSLALELQVFKAVLEGMASKIRYLQEYKLDRE
jgi:hypothetical protein